MALLASSVRLALALLFISICAFCIIKAMPADPARLALENWNLPVTNAAVAALNQQWGLSGSLPHQYGVWLVRFLGGDWGVSFRTGEPIFLEFMHRLPTTLTIGVGGLLLALMASQWLGFEAALDVGGLADHVTRAAAIFSQAVPMFWVGLVLIWVLGVKLRVIAPFATDATALILPLLLIASTSIGRASRVYRRSLIEAMGRPFFQTALAKGMTRRQAAREHCHRHALFDLLAVASAEAGLAIGGTATLEVLFGLPGVSQFLVQSVSARDYFVLQAYVIVIAVWMIATHWTCRFLLHRLDPRLP